MSLSPSLAYLLRLFLYLGIGAATFQLIVELARADLALELSRDDGPLEVTHFLAALGSGVMLLVSARSAQRMRPVVVVLGMLALVAAGRELDHFLEIRVFEHAYLLVTVPAGLTAAWVAVRHRDELVDDIPNYSYTAAGTLVAAGCFLVVVYAQLIGQKPLWEALMGPDYPRPVKDLAEESAEMMGYLLLLIGSFETRLLVCRKD